MLTAPLEIALVAVQADLKPADIAAAGSAAPIRNWIACLAAGPDLLIAKAVLFGVVQQYAQGSIPWCPDSLQHCLQLHCAGPMAFSMHWAGLLLPARSDLSLQSMS